MHRTLSLLAFLLFAAPALPAQAAGPDDEAAVRAVLDAYLGAFNRHDAEAHAALYADGAHIVWSDGEYAVVEDRAAFLEAGRAWHAANASFRVEAAPVAVRFLGPDVAMALVQGTFTGDGIPTMPMSIMLVLVRTPEGWQITAEHEAVSMSSEG